MAGEQARAFLMMALCGAACAGVYDLALLLVRLARGGPLWAGVMDIAFGVLLAAGMTLTALRLRMDPFRLYAFIGAGLGALIWLATVGRLWRRGMALAEDLRKKRQNPTENPQKDAE